MKIRYIILVLLALLITAGFVGAVSADDEVDGAPDIKTFTASKNNIVVGESVTFTWTVTNTTSYKIEYGDGNSFDGTTETTKTKKYDEKGTFTARLIAKNGADEVSLTQTITVSEQTAPAMPTITYSPDTITTSTTVTFTFSGSTGATKYKIDFGDDSDNEVTTTTATHNYSAAGTYKVNVKACNGNLESTAKEIEITVGNTIIDKIEITDVNEPRTGETPDKNGAIKSTSHSTIKSISWSPTETNDKFVTDKKYTVTVTVEPESGYEFSTGTITATIGGHAASIVATGRTKSLLSFTYEYDKTKPTISEVKLTIAKPSAGQEPATEITSPTTGVDDDESEVEWNPDDDKFEAGVNYEATIIVPAETGYSYSTSPKVYLNDEELKSGVSFTDNGDLKVIYDFTDKISKVYLTITEPAVGAKPDTTAEAKDDLVEVNNPVTWSPDNSIFAAGTTYKATINIEKESLNYADTVTYYINNIQASSNKKDDGSYDITTSFTMASEISKVVITLNAPVSGSSAPSTAQISSLPYFGVDGTVSWDPSVSTFGADTAYTAKIKVNTFSGYKFASSITATVNGNSATVSRNSDSQVTVSYTYPRTAKAPVTDLSTPIPTETETPITTSTSSDPSPIPNPIGIVQEFVKLFMALFNFDNYLIFQAPAETQA